MYDSTGYRELEERGSERRPDANVSVPPTRTEAPSASVLGLSFRQSPATFDGGWGGGARGVGFGATSHALSGAVVGDASQTAVDGGSGRRRCAAGTGIQSRAAGADGDANTCTVADSPGADSKETMLGTVRRFLLRSDPLLLGILKWGLGLLLLAFLTFIVFGMLYSSVLYPSRCSNSSISNSTSKEAGDDGGGAFTGPCRTRFGTIIGVSDGIFSYSNCNENYVSITDSYINVTLPAENQTGKISYTVAERYAGLAWQCVEYARRYWMLRGRSPAAYFGSVEKAADIWNLTFVRAVANTSHWMDLHRYANGDRIRHGLQPPEVGDLLIYPVQAGGFPAGHVAVVTKVEQEGSKGYVYVAEQNWDNVMWPGPYHNYSRKIPLRYDEETTALKLTDPDGIIVGWMRYGD